MGIDYQKHSSWPTVREAKVVANTVKHGDGPSASELFDLLPTLFRYPNSTAYPIARDKPRVDRPLLGEDLDISVGDVDRFRDSLIRFWADLADAMGRVS